LGLQHESQRFELSEHDLAQLCSQYLTDAARDGHLLIDAVLQESRIVHLYSPRQLSKDATKDALRMFRHQYLKGDAPELTQNWRRTSLYDALLYLQGHKRDLWYAMLDRATQDELLETHS
jgi:hypothetical protein